MTDWYSILTGVRAYALCPPGVCESCDHYWERLEARYAPEEPDEPYTVGQAGLDQFAEVAD